jgi:AmpD protein
LPQSIGSGEWIVGSDGWLNVAHKRSSPNCDARPNAIAQTSGLELESVAPSGASFLDLVVIHYISLPPEKFSGDGVERLFLNQLKPDEADPFMASLIDLRVSAHFFLRRNGQLLQFVSCNQRAWHAGVSQFQGRERCNDFSIGIELEGSSARPFTSKQYARLTRLICCLKEHYPIRALAGHSDIAPTRKQDPGPYFDWSAVLKATRLNRPQIAA